MLILHLSDLHFGQHSRFSNENPERLGQAFHRALVAAGQQLGIESRVNLVVVTGDIAETGKPNEFAAGAAFLGSLAGELGLERRKFVFVPGNHDVSWPACKREVTYQEEEEFDDDELRRRMDAMKLIHYEAFLGDFYDVEALAKIAEPLVHGAYLYSFPDLRVSVAALNSCEVESHRAEDHRGLISRAQAQSVMDAWHNDQATARWLKILAVHHNPVATVRKNVEQWRVYLKEQGVFKPGLISRYESDVVGFEGKEHLQAVVEDQNVQLVLHGHHHAKSETSWNWRQNGRAHVLSAGSLTLEADHLPKDEPASIRLIVLEPKRRSIRANSLVFTSWARTEGEVTWGSFTVDPAEPDGYMHQLDLPADFETDPLTPQKTSTTGHEEQVEYSQLAAEETYRAFVARACAQLPLVGLDFSASDATSMQGVLSLTGVYVSADVTTKEFGVVADASRYRKRAAIEAILDYDQSILLGHPGSGKSTFLNHLAYCLASRDFERLPRWPQNERQTIPIMILLRDFARWTMTLPDEEHCAGAQLLWQFVAHELRKNKLDSAIAVLQHALETGGAMVFLDGFDEVPSDGTRELVRDAVVTFTERFSKCRHLITCRLLSYREGWKFPGTYQTHELAPFDAEKIRLFIHAWYREIGEKWHWSHEQTSQLVRKLEEAVKRPDVRLLAPNPLLLTVMALVNTHEGQLPATSTLLYERAVELLLWRWERVKTVGSVERPQLVALLEEASRDLIDLRTRLENLAFENLGPVDHHDPDATADIREQEVLMELEKLHPEGSLKWARQLVHAMKLRTGLLLERQEHTFSFPHRTFHAYLAGIELSRRKNFGRTAAEQLNQGRHWRKVVLMAVGYFVHRQREHEKPLALVEALCPPGAPRDEESWQRIWLAGDVLIEMGLKRVEETRAGQTRLESTRKLLLDLVDKGALSAAERARAADSLAQLGDPRFDRTFLHLPKVFRGQPEPLLGFVEVPAGAFVMGSRPEEEGALEDEFGNPDGLEIAYGYHIGRYPVTVAQFEAFIQEDGYNTESWWSRQGWEWRQRMADSTAANPRYQVLLKQRGGPHNRPVGWDQQQAYATRPVTGISWFEAEAYTHWLDVRLRATNKIATANGNIVRLPTEDEWEKSARFPDDRPQPWGHEPWGPERGIATSDIRPPTAVGIFGEGISSLGLLDLSGTVWEWCFSLYELYPYKPQDGRNDPGRRGNRVVRGGTWADNLLPRCAARFWEDPLNAGGNIGFRVVLAPPVEKI
ncbi:MAG: SUMF1/EgtB/PvdO family nonheme iron enzyme [bacterium]|nr:SUMF1/EgtB/PvdO family nonheme iron enzyme [bacterium]